MNKKITVYILIIVLIIIGIGFYLMSAKAPAVTKNPVLVGNPANTATTTAAEKAQSSVGSGVGSANPFEVNVNPYQGYKNPFQ